MIRNAFCNNIENIIKNNVNLQSRYVSLENTLIEDLFTNICKFFFDNDTDAINNFIDNYLQYQVYEKYNYKDKMIEIIKFIISYSILDDLFNDEILSKLSIYDINKCYDFRIIYEEDYYDSKSYPSIYFVIDNPNILEILNKYINNKYKFNVSGSLSLSEREYNILTDIYNGSNNLDAEELTKYISEISNTIKELRNIIKINVNKIIKK